MILLVGPSRSGKTQLLRQLGAKLDIEPLNVGLELGRRLAATPNNKRGFSAGELLREIAEKERTEDPLLLDNLELLFEPGLQINGAQDAQPRPQIVQLQWLPQVEQRKRHENPVGTSEPIGVRVRSPIEVGEVERDAAGDV